MKPLLIALLLSLLATVPPVFGQLAGPDSLRQLLRTQRRPDTLRVRRLQALSHFLKTTDAEQAIQVSHQALRLARALSDSVGQGEAMLALSNLYRRQNQFTMAHRYARQAQPLFARLGHYRGESRAWLELSTLAMVQSNPIETLEAALRGLPLAERAHDLQTQNRLKLVIGTTYYQTSNYDEAVPALKATLRIGRQLADHQMVLTALSTLGDSYQMLHDWPRALRCYQQALRLNRQQGDQQGEASSEISLAEVYSRLGNPLEALAHGQRARQLVRTHHDGYNIPGLQLALARAYQLRQQPDSTLALAHSALALSQRSSNSNTRISREAAQLLAETYASQRKFGAAYRFRTLQLAYDDTLSGEDTQRRTSALRYGYELDKRRNQIVLLTKTRQLQTQKADRQRQHVYGLLAGLGGVLLLTALLMRNIYLKQASNRRLQEKNDQIAAQRDHLDQTLTELQATQAQLVQHEKLASLGELTAGVAHEMQNPLNFINNFSDLSLELLDELAAGLDKEPLSASGRALSAELLAELREDQVRINQHGHRAARIVKSMLEHSRASSGQVQETDLNALTEDCLHRAYESWRTEHPGFSAHFSLHLAPRLPRLRVVPQDVCRVLLNLLANVFYALREKQRLLGASFQPEVCLRTQQTPTSVRIVVRDNGIGMTPAVCQHVFEPFFTTKPAGEGTGLGLSLSYDIVTKGHRGTLSVESREGEYTEFVVCLPLALAHPAELLPAPQPVATAA
ncbi:tetratricopeptide repeat protein [Hymenobacter sp. ISL-91]|uniref:tetratricopeptide repeat-containing sensor histidine kinase n=1 Tax=Hymenobacter sp. ISL-91 TaxID=2819151 RepID=UPI001BE60502|nr:tetratricopeptide repeat protein [Hymenobacter sp. ISL-91]MBT2556664.1 tetratricopeptide repeat protein [Hymenobacter sp. ISL-91]